MRRLPYDPTGSAPSVGRRRGSRVQDGDPMMMMRSLIIVVFLAFLTGCSGLSQVRADNRERLNGLSAGMSRQEVLDTMGTETIEAQGSVITNPYRTEMHRTGGHVVELLLYYTDIQKQDGAITDNELTPLVVIDGELDGWGWSHWNDVRNRFEIGAD